MEQGSNMILGKGMRTGISLVEMLIAIVLFGTISSIGYTYYKNFYDVGLAAKQARVSAVIDQATQLSNAYDLYVAKTGSRPTVIADLSASNIKILSETPPTMTEISTTGWDLNTTLTLAGTNDDIAFVYKIDASTISAADELAYCNVLNNIADSNWDLNATYTGATSGSVGTNADMYGTNQLINMLCGGATATTLSFVFPKTVTP